MGKAVAGRKIIVVVLI